MTSIKHWDVHVAMPAWLATSWGDTTEERLNTIIEALLKQSVSIIDCEIDDDGKAVLVSVHGGHWSQVDLSDRWGLERALGRALHLDGLDPLPPRASGDITPKPPS